MSAAVGSEENLVRFDVSIYLLKAGKVKAAEDVLFVEGLVAQELRDLDGGRFIPFPAKPVTPKWVEFVAPLLSQPVNLEIESQAPGGLLWIPRLGKTFLISFGLAHTRLREDWLEPDFGKKVALSVIPQGQVVEVRADQVFAKWHTASERAPRASGVREFGYEADRDLVSAVEGVPSKGYVRVFGEKVRGSTSLKFGVADGKLLDTLDHVAERFDSGEYRTIWPQIDYLTLVRDDALSPVLDAELNVILGGKKPEQKIALAAPSARSGDAAYPHHFVIGRLPKSPATAPYLLFGTWEKLAKSRGEALSVETARRTSVHFLDESKERFGRCNMYECFGAEVNHLSGVFVLFSGRWYEARKQFINDVNGRLKLLTAPTNLMAPWNSRDDEPTYNEAACKADETLTLFDKKLVWFGGGQSRFEFCDVMHAKTRTLYFVKQPGSSASVSHLLEQARRTAENFFSADDGFRKKLSANILKADKLANVSWLATRPKRHDWNLCLVLMGKEAHELAFFAKCGLARLIRELDKGGYNVSFQKV